MFRIPQSRMPERTHQWSWLHLGIPASIAGILVVLLPTWVALTVLVGTVVLTVATVSPFAMWMLVVGTYPFIYLQVFVGEVAHVPVVDALAIATALGVGIRFAVVWWRTGTFPQLPKFPGIWLFVAFLIVGACSVLNASDGALGIKYLLRPLVFFYVMFIMLPLLVIDTPKRLFMVFRGFVFVGVIVAAMGVWSLVFPPEPGVFRRALPISIVGFVPLGTNHNLIAEVLVSVIPIGMILAVFSHERSRRWYGMGTVLFVCITLLTFSRTGWLTLVLEGVVLLIAIARARGASGRRMLHIAMPVCVAAFLAVTLFSFTTVVESSNRNRIQLTAIALEQFRAHPWVGAGVGTFQEAVGRNRWYVADFGSPQEAHGMVQKLLAETGGFGLAAFLFLLVSVVARIVRVYRHVQITPGWRLILLALLCAVLGSIVFQLFQTSYFVSKLWLPLGVALAAAELAERGIRLRAGDSRAV